MKFNKMLKMLTEKNIYYKVPQDDIQKMYDFYYLTYLSQMHSALNKQDPKFIKLRDQSLLHSLEESVDTIVDHLYKRFHSKIPDAVLEETASQVDLEEYSKYKHLVKRFPKLKEFKHTRNNRKVPNSLTDLDDVPVTTLVRIAHAVLEERPNKGQEAWAKIAKGWLRLDAAKTTQDKIIAIDHIFDLEHAGYGRGDEYAPFLTRIGFAKSDETAIIKALNHKARVKKAWDLRPQASPLAQQIGMAISKALGMGTREGSQQEITDDYSYVIKKPRLSNPTKDSFIKWITKNFGSKVSNVHSVWKSIDKKLQEVPIGVAVKNSNKNSEEEDEFSFLTYRDGKVLEFDPTTQGRPVIKAVKAPQVITFKWLLDTFNIKL